MKVVHVSSVHQAYDNRIFEKEAVSLARAGHEVVVVAPIKRDGTRQEVRVRSVPVPSSRTERFVSTIPQVIRRAHREKADVYHLHDPELIPWGLAVSLFGGRVVYDVHEDLAAQTLGKDWIPRTLRPLVAKLARGLEEIAMRRLTAVIVAHPAISDAFRARNDRVIVLENYPRLREFMGMDGERASSTGSGDRYERGKLVDFGGVSQARATEEIVSALSLLKEDSNVELVLGGRVEDEELYERVSRTETWKRVEFRGQVEREAMIRCLGQASASLVLYSPAPNHMKIRSNRLYESLAAGLPVIVPDFPEWARFIDRHRCGIAVDPTSPEEIARAIERVVGDPERAREMGELGRDVVREWYSWESEEAKLVEVYRMIEESVGC